MDKNPEVSSTTKISKHATCGYSYIYASSLRAAEESAIFTEVLTVCKSFVEI